MSYLKNSEFVIYSHFDSSDFRTSYDYDMSVINESLKHISMEINIFNSNSNVLAEILADDVIINSVQDALDLMANCRYLGSDLLITYKHQFTDGFFDLKTGIAGDILQKFSNYRCRLAIVGDFSKIQSKSLRDFIYESNKVGRICFVENKEEAIRVLGQ